MKVFLSWSGPLSREIATAFHEWFELALPFTKPWMSSNDIGAGKRWAHALNDSLQNTDFGLIFLTKSNMHAPWILFESGAISKSIEHSRVIPILIDCSPSEMSPPLSQFQAMKIDRQSIYRLFVEVSALSNAKEHLGNNEKVFAKWWPELDEQISETLNHHQTEKIRPGDVRVLSEKELQILKLLSAGKTHAEIADELSRSVTSIEGFIRRIRKVLGSKTTEEAVLSAQYAGLIPED